MFANWRIGVRRRNGEIDDNSSRNRIFTREEVAAFIAEKPETRSRKAANAFQPSAELVAFLPSHPCEIFGQIERARDRQ